MPIPTDPEPSRMQPPFVDRATELAGLQGFLEQPHDDVPLCRLYQAPPASGFTSFLRQFLRSCPTETIVLYADGANEVSNNLFFQIISCLRIRHPALFTEFKESVRRRMGTSRGREILKAAFQCIPYFGPLTGKVSEEILDGAVVSASDFPSVVAEVVCEYLAELRRRVVFLIDNAQALDAWSMDLVRGTASRGYSHLSYAVGYVARSSRNFGADELAVRFESTGYGVQQVVFQRPNLEFLKELASALNQPLDELLASRLLHESHGDIYRLLASLRRREVTGNTDLELHEERISPLQAEILSFLSIARQGLRVSDLIALCTNSPHLFVADLNDMTSAIQELDRRLLVMRTGLPDGDELISLRAHGSPAVIAISEDRARRTVLTDQLYRFFSAIVEHGTGRHGASETVPLLYRLAKEVEPCRVPSLARSVLHISLCAGSVEGARGFVAEATDDQEATSFVDYFLLVIFHISVREYGRALALLERPPAAEWRRHRFFSILQAICLNRTRQHTDADAMIDRLLADRTTPAEKVVLVSFRISGRLHENDIEGAQKIFHQWRETLEQAPNFGYLLRNAAAAYRAGEALPLLNQSLSCFRDQADTFGFHTTLNNRGAKWAELHSWELAQHDFARAQARLELFGVNHLHIVENNLGLCAIYLGRLDTAEKHLRRSLLLAQTTMPSVYASLNLALFYALTGRSDASREATERWREAVANATFDRKRQKYFVNRGLLDAYLQRPRATLLEAAASAEQHPDRYDPGITQRAVVAIRAAARGVRQIDGPTLLALWSPCLLQYWYQNPLELFPEDVLSSHAVRHDVVDEIGLADSDMLSGERDA